MLCRHCNNYPASCGHTHDHVATRTTMNCDSGLRTHPTCLSERKRASCRSSDSNAPLPNGLVMDAWNASVGNSRDRWCNQRLVTQLGTCEGAGMERQIAQAGRGSGSVRVPLVWQCACATQHQLSPARLWSEVSEMIGLVKYNHGIRWYGQSLSSSTSGMAHTHVAGTCVRCCGIAHTRWPFDQETQVCLSRVLSEYI